MTTQRITRTASAAIVAAAFAAILAAPAISQAEAPGLVISVQNEFTPVTPMTTGAPALYANGGPAMHSVVSDGFRPGTNQRLFRSATAAAGDVVEITGAENLPAGTYSFFCGFHGGMTGTLVVADTNGGD